MQKIIDFGWKRLVRYFMAGLIAILPLMMTVAIVTWIFSFLRGIIGRGSAIGDGLANIGLSFFGEAGRNPDELASITVLGYVIGVALVVACLVGIGLVVELGAKRFLRSWTDGLFRRIPIVGSLYGSMTQLVDLFDQPEEAEIKAMSVVFCHFAEGGGTGILALMPSPEKILIQEVEYLVVMLPTAPVPFGGGLIFIPAKQVIPVDMSVDNFISIYVSMGVTTPEFMRKSVKAASMTKPAS